MRFALAPPSLVLAFVLLLAGIAPGGEPGPAELRDLVARRGRDLRLQTEFPEDRPERRNDGYVRHGGGGGAAGLSTGAATVLMWGALIVFAVLLLVTLFDAMRRNEKTSRSKRPAAAGDDPAAAGRMNAVRQESDALAAAGDYAGAMHALLLRGVEEMRSRLGVSFARSLTSREILDAARLDPRARACLGDIIGRVEISWFGAHLPGPDDYARCRDSFTALAAILERGGAA